jgi:hypothetical protein
LKKTKEEFKLASAETDKIKRRDEIRNLVQEPLSMVQKYLNHLARPDVIEIDAFNDIYET